MSEDDERTQIAKEGRNKTGYPIELAPGAIQFDEDAEYPVIYGYDDTKRLGTARLVRREGDGAITAELMFPPGRFFDKRYFDHSIYGSEVEWAERDYFAGTGLVQSCQMRAVAIISIASFPKIDVPTSEESDENT